ncbi:MAG: hypothetical protein CMK25_02125 [Porticoccaceae bacterium]|nr:hypothetical protein [Porticoccaceae bacterium]
MLRVNRVRSIKFSSIFSQSLGLLLLSGCTLLSPEQQPVAVCPVLEEPVVTQQQCPPAKVIERIVTKEVPAKLPPMATTAGKMHLPIVGAVEWVAVGRSELMMEARIDTGADTTSIHADNIQLIEKDGRRYVRFVLVEPETGRQVRQELRLRRRVLIKQSNGLRDRRFVVRMWVAVGDTRSRIDVNLTDRTDFEYPMLIGRNFLTDSLIVDVSRHHTIDK